MSSHSLSIRTDQHLLHVRSWALRAQLKERVKLGGRVRTHWPIRTTATIQTSSSAELVRRNRERVYVLKPTFPLYAVVPSLVPALVGRGPYRSTTDGGRGSRRYAFHKAEIDNSSWRMQPLTTLIMSKIKTRKPNCAPPNIRGGRLSAFSRRPL